MIERFSAIASGLEKQAPSLPIHIAGSGIYLPEVTILSETFDDQWRKARGWTERQTGVCQRFRAGAAETSSAMGAGAARRALEAAQIDADELDCIVSACSVMEQAIPSLATQIQNRLGLGHSGIPAFDINATCLSFVVALEQLACAINCGKYQRALIVSSEMPSRGLNPHDQATAPLFGDGAAAIILERSIDTGSGTLLGSLVRTYSAGGDYCRFRAGGTEFWGEGKSAFPYFEMDGKSLYRLATKHFNDFFCDLLKLSATDLSALKLIIPHQASGRALDWLQKTLNLESARLMRILETRGNQVAASIPSALHEAIANGRINRGDSVALIGTGAGLSLGGAILIY
jgi:3-oxoacyl-[acyl-carrier-protein] synthase-3